MKKSDALPLLLVIVAGAALFAWRLTGPTNLMDNDQERPAAYVLDALRNGHWICQMDWMGGVSSKPPLHTWLAALATLPFDRINVFSLYLPSALAVIVTAVLILRAGSAFFGAGAGLLGALMFLLSPLTVRQIALARIDALFAALVTGAALAAFRCWNSGGKWTAFWLLSALATLTKGPLGLLIAAAGLLAVRWDGAGTRPAPARGSLLPGLALFLLLTLGWFSLACAQMGPAVADRLFRAELIGHATVGDKGGLPLVQFYKPVLYFLGRFAPWSLATLAGLWSVFSRAAADPPARRFERFTVCWFVAGLVIFALAPHQRPDHLSPILPAAALLAGRSANRWLGRVRPAAQPLVILAVAAAMAAAIGRYDHERRDALVVRRSVGMETVAGAIREQAGDGLPLLHVDTPFTLQFHLDTMQTLTPGAKAARRLTGTEPVYVAACDLRHVTRWLPRGTRWYELVRWPTEGEAFVHLITNRPGFPEKPAR